MVYTNQQSLKYLLEQRITTQNQHNWLAKLLGYEFDIVYKTEASNKVVDGLSRRGRRWRKELRVVARPYWREFHEVLEEVEEDRTLKYKNP